jgi:hypothetical protein
MAIPSSLHKGIQGEVDAAHRRCLLDSDLTGERSSSRDTGGDEDVYMAHHLFRSAFAGGYKDARYLIAASIDRYLSMTEGYQKYGTNRITNQETGKRSGSR